MDIKSLVKLGQRQVELELELNDLSDKMKEKNKELERLRGGYQSEGEIPLAMQELELTEFRLEDGTLIKITEELKAPSMAAGSADREPMLQFLEKTGNGDAIKSTLTIHLAKDDDRKEPVVKALEKIKVPFDDYRTVHPSTLIKLLTEMLEAGEEVPLDELKVRMWRQSSTIFKK